MKRKLQIFSIENKKDAQIEQDKLMTPQQRWERMLELIEFSIAFSPNKQLKIITQPDRFMTLKRKQAGIKEVAEFLTYLADTAAVNVHGYTRATGDLDIWYNPLKENFDKLIKAIEAFGFETEPLKEVTDLTKGFIRLPVDPIFIELLTMIDGKLNFSESFQRAYSFNFHEVNVFVIGYDDLIQNKIMSRRAKDLEDIAQLEKRRSN